jgi:hypothetical protein
LVWREHNYPVTVVRDVNVKRLAAIDTEALEEADEAGFLAGNAMFQDLSGCTWEEASAAVAGEAQFIARLVAAKDLDAEADQIEEERTEAFEDVEALWNLDVGVIGAVIVLSAIGCAPVGSCNAGGFGGHHQARHPYVTFYMPVAAVDEVLALAEAAGLGLIVDADGLAHLYSDRDLGLAAFAQLAVARHTGSASAGV